MGREEIEPVGNPSSSYDETPRRTLDSVWLAVRPTQRAFRWGSAPAAGTVVCMPASAAVVGATGLVGGYCSRQLVDEPNYTRVVTLGRRDIDPLAAKHEHCVVDFGHPETLRPHLGVRDVFVCLGTTLKKAGSRERFREVDFDYPLGVAKMAKECGARTLLLVSSMGASKSSRVFYSRVKGELEEALRPLGFEGLHLLRPSLLLGERQEHRVGEGLAQAMSPFLSPLLRGPLQRYRPIDAADVAKAMVRLAVAQKTGTCVYESDEIAALAR